MRQAGKVFSLYKNSEEICNLEERILDFRKDILIKEIRKKGYVVDEVKGMTASGNQYVTRHIISVKTRDGLEDVGNIIDDEIITRDCERLDKFLEGYVVK
jgi:hypothetical protein